MTDAMQDLMLHSREKQNDDIVKVCMDFHREEEMHAANHCQKVYYVNTCLNAREPTNAGL